MKKVSLPTLLAYKKSLYTTLCLFYGYNSKDSSLYHDDRISFRKKLKEVTSNVESTRSVRADSKALIEKEKNIGAANIQTKEKAILPKDTDSLFLEFSLIVTNNWLAPYATNSKEFRDVYSDFTENLVKNKTIIEKISKLYTEQIYNAEWTWNNLKNSKGFEIFVYDDRDVKKLLTREEVEKMIFKGLTEEYSTHLKVECLMKMAEGLQVNPSQVFPTEDGKKKDISGVIYKPYDDQVAFTDVKIAAALRKFDLWYEENARTKIVLSPFGVDHSSAYAYRKENDNHLYKYLTNLVDFNEDSGKFNNFSENDYLFVLGCMILGGLYNDTKDETKKNKKEE